MATLAEEFFNKIVGGTPTPAEFLRTLTDQSNPKFEEDWLDFKCNPTNDKNLKEIWSELLSAFSNTEGGVLVWGIDARKDEETGIDAARELKPVPEMLQFVSRLKELLGQATDPPLPKVRVEAIPSADGASDGFIVCLVPESEEKPVSAELVKNKPFYHRAGASTHQINRALLRSLFYPQRRSRLYLIIDYGGVGESGRGDFVVSIRNDGPSTAQDVILSMTNSFDECHALKPDHSWERVAGKKEARCIMQSIHPGMRQTMLKFWVAVDIYAVYKMQPIEFAIYAQDRPQKSLNLKLTMDHLRGRDTYEYEV